MSQPSLFEMDSSAENCAVDRKAAELGKESFRSPVLTLPDVHLLGAWLGRQQRFRPARRPQYQGTIGNDVFSGVVMELDYGRHTVRMYDPAAFHYKGAGKSFPLTMPGRCPRYTPN